MLINLIEPGWLFAAEHPRSCILKFRIERSHIILERSADQVHIADVLPENKGAVYFGVNFPGLHDSFAISQPDKVFYRIFALDASINAFSRSNANAFYSR